MIRSNMLMVLLSLMVVSGLLVGCGSEDNPSEPGALYNPPATGSGLGLLAVQLEAFGGPLDSDWHQRHHEYGDHTQITSLFMTFDSIRVYASCECADSTMWDDSDPCGGNRYRGEHDDDHPEGPQGEYFELLTEPVTLDVMDLGPALTILLGTMELPAGDYSHVVLHVTDATVVTLDGETVPVTLPEDGGVFVPVAIRFTILDGEVTEIVIVHDLTRSIHEEPPGSGKFFITPFMEGHHQHGDHEHGGGDGGEHDGGDHGDGGGHGHM
jgi:hypothetical protein